MKSRLALDRAHVIPNGVDLDLFSPIDLAQARQTLGLDLTKKFILFPYDRAEARKRYDLIEAAAALACTEIPELEILCVRGVPRHLMPLYMNAADVLVLASLFEGSPNAVKEAMAVNLPVVAVDVGDVAELLGPAEGNYLVPRNPGAMASRIVEVCRASARSRGRAWISRLSMPNVARQIVEVYANIMSGVRG
jgi:glycosyltransferase involved in cell wall biosynthesis